MNKRIDQIKASVISGKDISFDEAMELYNIDDNHCKDLYEGADHIRKEMTGNDFHLCSIINAKSGNCSENCKFCAQSSHYNIDVENYPLVSKEKVLEAALDCERQGVNNFSLVTSGKGPTKGDIEGLCEIYKELREKTTMSLCASHGVLTDVEAEMLKDAGVTRYHHNLEAGPDYYGKICTTHPYEDRINTIKSVQRAGLEVCSGGIIGMGETMKDRIEMALDLRELGIKSVPINILNPVKGTPLEGVEKISDMDILKTIAIYRFILPEASLRYAGGRQLIGHIQRVGLRAGINAALVGDLLTTLGTSVKEDKEMIKDLGFDFIQNY